MRLRMTRTRTLLGTGLLVVALGGTAIAAPNPPQITGGPADGGYTNDDPVQFTWQSGGGGNGAFGWAMDGGLPDLTAFVGDTSAQFSGLGEGQHTFVVGEGPAADDPDPSPSSAQRTFTVDRTPPSISDGLSGAAGDNGWYVDDVTRTFECSDANLASCPGDETRTAQGDYAFPARTAADKAGNTAAAGTREIKIDKIAPTVPSPGFSPALNGTRTIELGSGSLNLVWGGSGACSDGTSGIGSCGAYFSKSGATGPWTEVSGGAALDVGQPGVGAAGQVGDRWVKTEGKDNAGNITPHVVRYTVQDTQVPLKPITSSPSPLGVVKDRTPTFTWLPTTDQGTGVHHYELVVDGLAAQTVQCAQGAQECSFEWTGQLSVATHSWKVRAVDFVGKSSESDLVSFRIDPNAPDPPTLTAGPRGFTNVSAPTFSFTGFVGNTFTWSLWDPSKPRVTGSTPLQGGSTKAGTAAVTALPDGQYVFEVIQTGENAVGSPAATAAFTVDTKAPAVPQVTSSPGTTGNTQPSFAWSGAEANSTFRWKVTSPTGETRLGPGSVSTASVTLPAPLPGGGYQFRVQQVDQAGNESGWSAPEAFTVVAAAASAPPSGTTSTPGTPSSMVPATKNSKALTPKAGVSLGNLRPLLKWKRFSGATLYNVQVYKITPAGLVKVLSVFPKASQYRMVPGVLKKSTRYSWRVWPYLGKKKRYSAAPIGTSWFDVSAKAVNPKLKPKKKTVKKTVSTATRVSLRG